MAQDPGAVWAKALGQDGIERFMKKLKTVHCGWNSELVS